MKVGELIKVLNSCDVVLGEMHPESVFPFVELFKASTGSPVWTSYADREVHSIVVREDLCGVLAVGIKPEECWLLELNPEE